MKKGGLHKVSFFIVSSCLSFFVRAQHKPAASAQELANKLANPAASLVSVPFQNNIDYGIGPYNGSKYTLNFQPVIPIPLGPKLNLITRYIIPIVDQRDITGDGESQFGLSDANVSAFFAPAAKNGFTWAVGPVFLFPTGTADLLSARKWGIGPTVLILKQGKGLTYGFLTNQLWSFAGDENRDDVNQLFFQPFFSHNWKSGAGITINAEMNFNWQANTTSIFLNPSVSGVTKLGKQTVSLGLGPRIPLAGAAGSRPDLGLRASFTLVFPK